MSNTGRSLERYAKEVAEALHARGEMTRRPRLASTRTETISEGLFGLRHRTVTHRDDGGAPSFWIIGAHRDSGEQALYHPRPGQVSGHSWMAGHAALLLENGNLRSASWREDPIGSYWLISDVRGMDVSRTTMLDSADKGRWKKARTTGREQYRETFDRYYASEFPAGAGFRIALERLFYGTGVRMDDTMTGMSAPPRGPEWSVTR